MAPVLTDRYSPFYWRPLEFQPFPWVRNFDRILCVTPTPRLGGDTLYVTSDTGGLHAGSRFEAVSLLVMDFDGSPEWPGRMSRIRARYLPDGRRMSFKNLNDGHRRRALVPFLEAADDINGLCVTIAVEKRIQSAVVDDEFLDAAITSLALQAKWRRALLSRAIRTTFFLAMLLGGLHRPGQNVYWISDRDDLFANHARSCDVARLLGAFSSVYVNHAVGELGIGTTELDEGDRGEEDLAALPDLVAGAASEALTALADACQHTLPSPLARIVPETLSNKASLLCGWMSDETQRLKRVNLMFAAAPNGGYSLSRFHVR